MKILVALVLLLFSTAAQTPEPPSQATCSDLSNAKTFGLPTYEPPTCEDGEEACEGQYQTMMRTAWAARCEARRTAVDDRQACREAALSDFASCGSTPACIDQRNFALALCESEYNDALDVANQDYGDARETADAAFFTCAAAYCD